MRKTERHSQRLQWPLRPLGNGAIILPTMGKWMLRETPKGAEVTGAVSLLSIVREEKFHGRRRIETKVLKDGWEFIY